MQRRAAIVQRGWVVFQVLHGESSPLPPRSNHLPQINCPEPRTYLPFRQSMLKPFKSKASPQTAAARESSMICYKRNTHWAAQLSQVALNAKGPRGPGSILTQDSMAKQPVRSIRTQPELAYLARLSCPPRDSPKVGGIIRG